MENTNDFDTALNVFLEKLQENVNEYFKRYQHLEPDLISVESGGKYARIVRTRDAGRGGRSVHCFVATQDNTTKALGTVKKGDILKAASWKAPAKHVRGSIFAKDFGGYGVDTYGANYLK